MSYNEIDEMNFFYDDNECYDEYEEDKVVRKNRISRSGFTPIGKYGLPLIKKDEIDLDKVDLWGYSKVKKNDELNKDKTIHFFMHDWKFENVYEKPEKALEKLDQYYALLTPEFSMYYNMPLALQLYSIFKNRWCGAYWQRQGMRVIPTVEWGIPASYEFCFDAIEKGSVVAVSTYGRENLEGEFMEGFNKMLEVVEPSAIVCYGEPFASMKGKIKSISPFDKELLIKQLGYDEFLRRYLSGELYPSV